MKDLGSTGNDCRTVLKWALVSRIGFILLQAASHTLIPDHAASMEDVFMERYRYPPHNPIVETCLGGFDNWDSEYFIFVAEHGYGVHEQTMAFFPLLPALMWTLSRTLLRPLSLLVPVRSVLLVSGASINFCVFPFTAVSLYLLTQHLSKSRRHSLLAAALVCFNPATVFMSAVYTECVFAFFTFSGLLALEKGRSWTASLLFMLAVGTRSNGVVLCGFLGYQCLVRMYESLKLRDMSNMLGSLVSTATQCVLVILPFVSFQFYGYHLYCGDNSATPRHSSTPVPVWCFQTLPLPYSFIQQHYWSNGFLRYFQLKQTPNFLLVTPMVLLCCYCLLRYFKKYIPKKQTRSVEVESSWLRSEGLRPYAFHLGFLLVFGTFFMNVQVITRLVCSASPMIYWYSSDSLLSALHSQKAAAFIEPKLYGTREMASRLLKAVYATKSKVTVSKAILSYFIFYVFIGFCLHCNFYPWT